ncbi:RNA 3'-terminal phosphate cyclase [Pseudoalteromonas citrea]|uniref:RNA 3'-terminal phosphate cyclase n=2 Tax=Pseudoalteromonas citrea TaxID=43655 RepID=A0A5S3XLQ6_9GAMM|nr:RNA 3'-terminal phosphate cyclase [Pseudoalteromonas citrea]TMP55160.1 RNA 3'-terminal phosphate cyclase [Pseudoalteromonas citrea]
MCKRVDGYMNSDYLIIDGAQGEGGGQVLRTALTLSILTQRKIEFINIRAGRKKPGLLRQHLTSVLAAQAVCKAEVDGVELGSSRIRFSPGEIKAGNFEFAIGTAGSTALVCQTILPVLALAAERSTVLFEGGTHNGMSPSLSFLQQSFFPILALMGVRCKVDVYSLGFYPAGGGKWQITIEPTAAFNPIQIVDSGSHFANKIESCAIHALLSALPKRIGDTEVATAKKLLDWQQVSSSVQQVSSQGPGNSFQLSIASSTHRSVFEVIGERGLAAKEVARRAAARVSTFIEAHAAIEEQLADQLLLPIALAGSGSFTTTKPSLHTITNIDVIKQVLGKVFVVEQLTEVLWRISLHNDELKPR